MGMNKVLNHQLKKWSIVKFPKSLSSRADVCLDYFHGYLVHSVIYGPLSNSFIFLQGIFQMCMEDADSTFKPPSQPFISMWIKTCEGKHHPLAPT